MARHLMDEQRPRDAARLGGARQGDVIGDEHCLDGDAQTARPLRSEAEIEPVARVILHDDEASRRAAHRQDSSQNRIRRGRGEDIAADRRIQQTGADESRMGGFVPRPAAGNDRDLARVALSPEHHANIGIAVEPCEHAAARGQQAIDGIGDEAVPRLDEVPERASHDVVSR